MKSGKKLGFILAICAAVLLVIWFALRRHSSTPPSPPALEANATNLHVTRITAVLDTVISAGTNVLWCGTFQLAWNEAVDFFGEDLRFAEETPLAVPLNLKAFTKQNLDEESYVVAGGVASRGLLERLRHDVSRKFGKAFQTELIPQTTTNPALFFYACLFKSLAFKNQFQPGEQPLLFGTNRVTAFGIEAHAPHEHLLREQVQVIDYQQTTNFIIELRTKSAADRLILAKIPPKGTLTETVNEVRQRIETRSGDPIWFERLVIPKIDFALVRIYDELIGKHPALKNASRWPDLSVSDAKQIIRFRLDERGALLKSEAVMPVATAAAPEPVHLVFDQPFLLLMQRADSTTPYFALWIDNAELLVPWGPATHSPTNHADPK